MIRVTQEQFSDQYSVEQKQKSISPPINRYTDASIKDLIKAQKLVDQPKQIQKKSYSLEPDMATGWRPKKKFKVNYQNVFPLTFSNNVNDQVLKQLSKKKQKYSLVYIGSRKSNSYLLHQQRQYTNPYPIQKKIDRFYTYQPVYKYSKIQKSNLSFNSDFQSGNLDIAIQIAVDQFDLFMRVDTNTKGHTNWYYFQVQNKQWTGSVKFNICNFRRDISLYQRGMKPYISSKKSGEQWSQKGRNISYQKKKLRYKFLYDQEDDFSNLLHTYFIMSFTYDFQQPNDKVKFAYCIPYTYTNMLEMIRQVKLQPDIKCQTIWRTLSGLPVPLIQITDFNQPPYNKKIVLVTARIHPGQSNSSHVCEGFIRYLVSSQKPTELLRKYHFFIIPMLNPDGVVAGNYRTSLFGKDLNRTFNQSRKYAFPQTFHLIQYAKALKKQHKQRFTIYLDLHGHSVKKNVFFYGPDYSICHSYYNPCRQYAKILGNLTNMFRYYSCIFRISSEKATTARATLNRLVNIPFTYTMQSSNGSYYDSQQLTEKAFTSQKWKQMGQILVKGLSIWAQKPEISQQKIIKKSNYVIDSDSQEQIEDSQLRKFLQAQPPGQQKISDDELSEGGSDSEPQQQDLDQKQLQALQKQIEGKKQEETQEIKQKDNRSDYPTKTNRTFKKDLKDQRMDWSNQLRKSNVDIIKSKINPRLPPINLQMNHASFLSHKSKKKKLMIEQGLKNLTSMDIQPIEKPQKKNKLQISHLLMQMKKQPLVIQQTKIVLKRKTSRQEIFQSMRKYK